MGYNTGSVIAPLVCVIGHARSTIVDTIYAHTVESALAGVSERVADRVGVDTAQTTRDPRPSERAASASEAPHDRWRTAPGGD